jgi:hypothetical protein
VLSTTQPPLQAFEPTAFSSWQPELQIVRLLPFCYHSKSGVHRGCGVGLHIGCGVHVQVCRRGNFAVPEPFAGDFQMDAAREHVRRVRVAQIVETQARQTAESQYGTLIGPRQGIPPSSSLDSQRTWLPTFEDLLDDAADMRVAETEVWRNFPGIGVFALS